MNKYSNKNGVYRNDGGMLELFELDMPPEANLQLPDPKLLLYYQNLSNRILWVHEIDENTLEDVKNIYKWNAEDEKAGIPVEERIPIKVMCESFGGLMNICFDYIFAMNISKTPIYTYALSATMSAGALIFINGHKGHRYITPYTSFLLHEGSTSGVSGTFSQVEANQSNYKKMQEMMRNNIFSNTKIDAKMWGRKGKTEWYLYADECIKLGVADKIIDNISDVIGACNL